MVIGPGMSFTALATSLPVLSEQSRTTSPETILRTMSPGPACPNSSDPGGTPRMVGGAVDEKLGFKLAIGPTVSTVAGSQTGTGVQTVTFVMPAGVGLSIISCATSAPVRCDNAPALHELRIQPLAEGAKFKVTRLSAC